jgi:propane monooxygenase small subunit
VFEPLVGELFRSSLVQQASPGNGDFVTPTVMGAGEYDYAARDLRYTKAMFELLTNDKEFADYNKQIIDQWLTTWVPRCIRAAREMQPLWSQPDFKPPRFEDCLDRAKNRFSGILSELSLNDPQELTQ